VGSTHRARGLTRVDFESLGEEDAVNKFKGLSVVIGLATIILLWTACAEETTPSSATSSEIVSLTVDCTTSYREQGSSPFATEVLTLSSVEPQVTADLGDLRFQATYFSAEGSGEGRSLRVSVMVADSGAELSSQLYQMSKTEHPQNEFIGGHGFTGLAYAFHPTSRTELQYWCVAR